MSTIGGQVTDSVSQQPVAHALVAIYAGPLSAASTTTVAGDSNYLYSTTTDDTGGFGLSLVAGTYAVWVFAPGYHCAVSAATDATAVTLTPVTSSEVLPTIGDANFLSARVIPSDEVNFSAHIMAGSAKDPLSHQVFLFNPGTSLLIPLNAPGAATDMNSWPSGAWASQFKAPSTVGDFNVTLVAATEAGLCAFATALLTIAR